MKPAEILSRAVALVAGKEPTSRADVESALRDCEARAIAATSEIERLAMRRPDLLIDGSDVDVEKHDATASRTSIERDRANEVAGKLRERLAAIVAAEAAAERNRHRADVELECEIAADAVRERYPKAVAEMRALLRTLAKAQMARERFAATYPGEPRIADPETAARQWSAPPDAVVSETVEWRWATLDGRAVHDSLFNEIRLRLTTQQKSEIETAKRAAYRATGSQQLPRPLFSTEVTSSMLDEVKAGGGRAYVFEDPYGHEVKYMEMVRREVRRLPRQLHPMPLASSISLPELNASGEHDSWSPTGRLFQTGDQLLAELDLPRTKPYRPVVVEYVSASR